MMIANYASSQNRGGGGRKYNGGRGQYSGQGSGFQNSYTRGHGRGGRNGQGRGNNNFNLNNKPQCQFCGKFGHTVHSCYHHFDISFQGS